MTEQLYRRVESPSPHSAWSAPEGCLSAEDGSLLVPVEPDYSAAVPAGHAAYERYAPTVGYATREATRVDFDELPPSMIELMHYAYRAGVDAALGIGGDDG